MVARSMESFWWEDVAGPRSLVSGIADAIGECKCVVLTVPSDLPWRHQMRNSVRSAIESIPGFGGLYIESIDVADEASGETPSSLILSKFALYEDRIHYRAGVETVQQYAARKGFLAKKIIWVKGANRSEVASWIEFCSQWRPKDPTQGLFVIEEHGGIGDYPRRSKLIRYSDCVDENSVRLFAWSVLTEEGDSGLTPPWRRYMVSLLTNLCRDDVEVAASLSNALDVKLADPLEVISDVSRLPLFARRGEAGSDHVLALVREGRQEELRRRVWGAQIEALFPLIEEARIALVDLLEEELGELIEEGRIVQYDGPVSEVHDIELGTLVHLMSRDADGNRPLYVRSQEIRSLIYLLWKCRNLLAHREVCSPEMVNNLLSSGKSSWS